MVRLHDVMTILKRHIGPELMLMRRYSRIGLTQPKNTVLCDKGGFYDFVYSYRSGSGHHLACYLRVLCMAFESVDAHTCFRWYLRLFVGARLIRSNCVHVVVVYAVR